MDAVQTTSNLIGDIYDAALDPGLWPSVLKSTCAYVGGSTSALLSQDAVRAQGNALFVWGGDSSYKRTYFDTYMKIDPILLSSQCYAEVGQVYSTDMLMPYDEFVASRFFREWAKPQGLCDSVWSLFEKTSTSAAGITVLRHERDGRVNDEARDRMGLLVPHFRRAVAIGKVIDFHKSEASALGDALDGLSAAVFLVDAEDRVTHCNLSARAMLSEGKVLRLVGDRLTATDQIGEKAIRDASLRAGALEAIIAPTTGVIPLTSQDGKRWVAHFLSLSTGSRRKAGAAYSAVVALFVHRAWLDQPMPIETMSKLFNLTPGKSRVLAASVKIGVGAEMASVLGIAETTVKTHLQHIFAKTGVKRQSDLAKLVASYSSPLGAASPDKELEAHS